MPEEEIILAEVSQKPKMVDASTQTEEPVAQEGEHDHHGREHHGGRGHRGHHGHHGDADKSDDQKMKMHEGHGRHHGGRHGRHHKKHHCCMACPFIGLGVVLVLHAIFQYKQLEAVRSLEEITGKKKWGGCGQWRKNCGPVAWKGGRWGGYGRCGPRMTTQI